MSGSDLGATILMSRGGRVEMDQSLTSYMQTRHKRISLVFLDTSIEKAIKEGQIGKLKGPGDGFG